MSRFAKSDIPAYVLYVAGTTRDGQYVHARTQPPFSKWPLLFFWGEGGVFAQPFGRLHCGELGTFEKPMSCI